MEHIKDVLKIDPLSVKGKASVMVLLSVLLYQFIVYYNFRTIKQHPKAIKYILVYPSVYSSNKNVRKLCDRTMLTFAAR